MRENMRGHCVEYYDFSTRVKPALWATWPPSLRYPLRFAGRGQGAGDRGEVFRHDMPPAESVDAGSSYPDTPRPVNSLRGKSLRGPPDSHRNLWISTAGLVPAKLPWPIPRRSPRGTSRPSASGTARAG